MDTYKQYQNDSTLDNKFILRQAKKMVVEERDTGMRWEGEQEREKKEEKE